MVVKSFVLGLAVALASPLALAQAPVVKVCALLRPAELQAIAGMKVSDGMSSFQATTATHACQYRWTAPDFRPNVQVLVGDAGKMYPDKNAATVKLGYAEKSKEATPLPGIGEAASFRIEGPTRTSASAYLSGGRIVQVVYEATDAQKKREQLIGLLKAAVSRL